VSVTARGCCSQQPALQPQPGAAALSRQPSSHSQGLLPTADSPAVTDRGCCTQQAAAVSVTGKSCCSQQPALQPQPGDAAPSRQPSSHSQGLLHSAASPAATARGCCPQQAALQPPTGAAALSSRPSSHSQGLLHSAGNHTRGLLPTAASPPATARGCCTRQPALQSQPGAAALGWQPHSRAAAHSSQPCSHKQGLLHSAGRPAVTGKSCCTPGSWQPAICWPTVGATDGASALWIWLAKSLSALPCVSKRLPAAAEELSGRRRRVAVMCALHLSCSRGVIARSYVM
jgi:hypothetical protein